MKYFAVLLPMLDTEKSQEFRAEHLEFLEQNRNEGTILINGRFLDGAGGLVIYQAHSFEDVQALVQKDPYVIHGARSFEIHEWEMIGYK